MSGAPGVALPTEYAPALPPASPPPPLHHSPLQSANFAPCLAIGRRGFFVSPLISIEKLKQRGKGLPYGRYHPVSVWCIYFIYFFEFHFPGY